MKVNGIYRVSLQYCSYSRVLSGVVVNMVRIAPFKGIMYNTEKVQIEDVITPPYDVIHDPSHYSGKSEYNFVRIILNKDHQKAASLLKEWLMQDILIRDKVPAIYLYEQAFAICGKRFTRTSFISLAGLEEIGKGVFPHEKTLAKPLADRISLMEHTKSDTGIVFFLYDDEHRAIAAALKKAGSEMLFSFRDSEGIIHSFSRIDDRKAIIMVMEEMRGRTLNIADGHHRYRSALEFRKNYNYAGYVLGAFVNSFDDGLILLPPNRLMPDIGLDPGIFLKELKREECIKDFQGE